MHLAILLSLTLVGAAAASPSQGLVLHLPLDGDGDARVGAQALVEGATPTRDRAGRAGGAVRLDGVDDHLTLGAPLPTGSGPSTHAAWVRRDTGTGRGVLLGLYDKPGATNLEVNRGQLRVYWNHGKVDTYAKSALDDGKWHHLALLRDPSADRMEFWVDAELVGRTKAGPDATWLDPHRIGADYRGSGTPRWKGDVDDLRVWSRALPREELVQLVHGPAARTWDPEAADVAARWPLDDDAEDANSGRFSGRKIGTRAGKDRAGKSGGGLHFDGEEARVRLRRPLDCGAGPSTWTAWVWVAKGRGRAAILGNYPHPHNLLMEISSQGLRWYWNEGQVDLRTKRELAPVTYEAWHHVAAVRDPGTDSTRLYVDARLAAEGKAGDDVAWEHVHLLGSDDRGSASVRFQGDLDEVVVYRRALSEEELTQLVYPEAAATIAPRDAGVAAHWPLDGHLDEVNSGRFTAIARGEPQPAKDRFGRAGQALRFDGEDDAAELVRPLDAGTGPSTWLAWVRVEKGRSRANILGNYPRDQAFNWEVQSGRLRAYWNNGKPDLSGRTGPKLNDGAWHHVAMVRDPGADALRLYVDGEESAAGPAGDDLTWRYPHVLGADYRGGSSVHFQGDLDELRVLRRAMTASEVKATAEESKPPPPPPARVPIPGKAEVASEGDEEPDHRVDETVDTTELEARLRAIVAPEAPPPEPGVREAPPAKWLTGTVTDHVAEGAEEMEFGEPGTAPDTPEAASAPETPPAKPSPAAASKAGAAARSGPLPPTGDTVDCSAPPGMTTPTYTPADIGVPAPPEPPPGLPRFEGAYPPKDFTGIAFVKLGFGVREHELREGKKTGWMRLVKTRKDGTKYVSEAELPQPDGSRWRLSWDSDGSFDDLTTFRGPYKDGPFYDFDDGVVWQEDFFRKGKRHGHQAQYERGRLKVWVCEEGGQRRQWKQWDTGDGHLAYDRGFYPDGTLKREDQLRPSGQVRIRKEFDQEGKRRRTISYDEAGAIVKEVTH